ncbi:lipopolysaccharide biosynthesis protein [Fibrobacter succinogenes]|uniref:Membrane protein involved in the export of O-antigen and teichoic acid n=1 Tax=Fibrobacter succinogenes TaxID=833 RepID=A0A380S7H2_FIBSU|nr:lipopolysaccharide biosynthesis protein [Fibrobacter succinogenes]PWJ34850.1 O-antigen/teichoic acid export membrane protein [Fibrobacter succinogenes subsp. elongatus]SUQ24973.1 Membrane protein involved in the export of O-antigen and teichoic acid [Fibrobacter succinogenes]
MSLKSSVVTSLVWKFLERIGTQGVSFVVAILLARLLSPKDFGLVALVTVFVSVANVFVQSGLNTALIQKKDADDLDFSTVFFSCLALALILYAGLFFGAPLIARFYNNQMELVPVVRVLGLMLPLGALNSIQEAYVARHMMFKKLFYRSVGAVIPAGIIGVLCAFYGLGVWSLVVQQILNAVLICIIMWFTVKWRPSFSFSFQRWKGLFSFGWKLLCSAVLDTFYRNLRDLVIGKMFTPADLGFYNRGDQFPKIIITNINTSIQSVLLPSLSSVQDDRERLKSLARRSIKLSSFLILPMMAGLAAVAEPLTLVVLGERWLPAVPFIQICCFSYAFWPIHTTNLSAINAVGRSDVFLKLEIVKKGYELAVLVIVIYAFCSPVGIAMSAAITAPLGSFVNAYPNKKLLNYGFVEQMKDVAPPFILSAIMGACVYFAGCFMMEKMWVSLILLLIILCLFGFLVYLGLAMLFRIESLDYIMKNAKDLLRKKGFLK